MAIDGCHMVSNFLEVEIRVQIKNIEEMIYFMNRRLVVALSSTKKKESRRDGLIKRMMIKNGGL